MGFKLRSGNGPLQFKQMGSSPAQFDEYSINKSSTPTHPDADKPYVKPNLTKEAEEKAPKLTKDQMKQNKSDDKETKKQRKAHYKTELKKAKETGKNKTNEQKANTKLELQKQKEIDKQLEEKEKINLAGMSKAERKQYKADQKANQKANSTEEGKGKNWLGRTWDKYKAHVGSQEYYDIQDSFNEFANQVRLPSDTRAPIATNKGKTNRDKKLAEDALALSNTEKEEAKKIAAEKVTQTQQNFDDKLEVDKANSKSDIDYKNAQKDYIDTKRLEIQGGLVKETKESVTDPNVLANTGSFEEDYMDK